MSPIYLHEPFSILDLLFDESCSQQHKSGQKENRNANSSNLAPSLKPRLDLKADDKENLVTATFEFPGLSKEQVHVEVQNGKLTVSAETSKAASDHNDKGYIVRERRFGKFSRTLQLPQGVKDGEIHATMENGILTVVFPQTRPDVAPTRVTVS